MELRPYYLIIYTRKVNALLNILPDRGSKAFDAFLVALRKNGHEELATSIQK